MDFLGERVGEGTYQLVVLGSRTIRCNLLKGQVLRLSVVNYHILCLCGPFFVCQCMSVYQFKISVVWSFLTNTKNETIWCLYVWCGDCATNVVVLNRSGKLGKSSIWHVHFHRWIQSLEDLFRETAKRSSSCSNVALFPTHVAPNLVKKQLESVLWVRRWWDFCVDEPTPTNDHIHQCTSNTMTKWSCFWLWRSVLRKLNFNCFTTVFCYITQLHISNIVLDRWWRINNFEHDNSFMCLRRKCWIYVGFQRPSHSSW